MKKCLPKEIYMYVCEVIKTNNQMKKPKTNTHKQMILEMVERNNQFSNEVVGWFTLSNFNESRFIIDHPKGIMIFIDCNKYVNKLIRLMNTGK